MKDELMNVQVALLPSMIDRSELTGRVAVVIDVLRATTTLVEALSSGAASVIPCRQVEEAQRCARDSGSVQILTGGERHGRLIEGFDLDNSPFSYSPSAVAGRVIAFTTTNGTQAIAAAAEADRVLIGAFLNRRALAEELRRDGRPVLLVCAGTDGHITAEDVLFAGGLADELTETGPSAETIFHAALNAADIEQLGRVAPSHATAIAIEFYRACGRDSEARRQTMRQSRGGSNLLEIGNARDIDRAAEDSVCDIIPEWDRTTGRITVPR